MVVGLVVDEWRLVDVVYCRRNRVEGLEVVLGRQLLRQLVGSLRVGGIDNRCRPAVGCLVRLLKSPDPHRFNNGGMVFRPFALVPLALF